MDFSRGNRSPSVHSAACPPTLSGASVRDRTHTQGRSHWGHTLLSLHDDKMQI